MCDFSFYLTFSMRCRINTQANVYLFTDAFVCQGFSSITDGKQIDSSHFSAKRNIFHVFEVYQPSFLFIYSHYSSIAGCKHPSCKANICKLRRASPIQQLPAALIRSSVQRDARCPTIRFPKPLLPIVREDALRVET